MTRVVRLPNWVGDTLLALPAIRALADAPGGRTVLAGRALPLLLAGAAAPVDRLELGRGGVSPRWVRDARELRALRADSGVLLTPSLSSALWLCAAGVPERIGWAEQGRGSFLTRRVPRAPRGERHLAEEFVELARAAGAQPVSALPRLPAAADAARAARAFLATFLPDGAPFVALCPGAQYGPAKQWPVEAYAELSSALAADGFGGLVLGTEADRAAADAILARAAAGWASAIGAGSILVAAELLRRASVAVSNDSGAMHLAAGVGTPVVALFGPTSPAWTGPRGAGHEVVTDAWPCAPCFRRRCPFGDPSPCLAGVGPERVRAAVRRAATSKLEREADGEGLRPALFVDRDGTLLELVPYLRDPAQARLTPGAAAALRRAREAGYAIVVVTNQSGVARGLFSGPDVDRVHARVRDLLAAEGAAVDRFLVCPHHPDFTGPCACRKPGTGLLLQGAAELGVDLRRSWTIGDTLEDLLAGDRGGTRTILVRTGYGAGVERDRSASLPPGAVVEDDLAGAVARVLGGA